MLCDKYRNLFACVKNHTNIEKGFQMKIFDEFKNYYKEGEYV